MPKVCGLLEKEEATTFLDAISKVPEVSVIPTLLDCIKLSVTASVPPFLLISIPQLPITLPFVVSVLLVVPRNEKGTL